MAQNSAPVPFSASSSKAKPSRPLLHAILHAPPPVLLELVNAFADDMYALSLIGLLGKRTGERAGKICRLVLVTFYLGGAGRKRSGAANDWGTAV